MRVRTSSRNSTTVRNITMLALLRASFLVEGWLAPAAAVRRAARLFATPQPSSRTRARRAAAVGAEEHQLVVDGLPLQVYVWGDPAHQPYVLFSHGWSSHGTRIAAWLPRLRDAGFAVVAFDQAAHGKSGGVRTTLPAFACHLIAVGRRFGPAHAVIGHSLGGAAAMLALASGLRAERAVLLAPPADPLAAAERFSRFVWLAAHLSRRMFARFERALRVDAEDLQAHRIAPAVARPALVVHDLEDREVPWAEGERYARLCPQARLLTTRGLGHHRIVDDTGVIEAAMRFLRGEAVGDRVVSTPNLPYGIA